MDRLGQLGVVKDLSDGGAGKRLVGGEAQPDGINGGRQLRETEKRILGPVDLLREHDVRRQVAGEIVGIHPEPALRGRRERVIQAQVSRDQIRIAVMVEIARGQTVPPAPQRRQAHRAGDPAQPCAVVGVKLHRHPLARRHQIQPPVGREIHPDRIGDHPTGGHQLGSQRLGDVGKPAPLIAEHVAAGRIGVVPRHQPAPDEQIWSSIAGEVAGFNGEGAGPHRRQRGRIPHKPAAAPVQVEAVLQQLRHR